jgi:pantoate--beta-alanine ligase
MVIFRKVADLQQYLSQIHRPVGYVPTMGALHAGHTSLIRKSKAEGRLTVCSIFVNPTQFNDPEDYRLYPKSTDEDTALLLEADCDVLFLPDEHEVYPDGTVMTKAYSFGDLESVFEGAQRPGHFRGVGQVMGRFLDIIKPAFLYMGQKDYQQCLVIKDLIKLMGRDGKTELVICPTRREPDGLAMSSRNRRLTDPQRSLSSLLYQCLISIQTKSGNQSFSTVQKECLDLLQDKGFNPEYVELADAASLRPLSDFDSSRPMVALIAAKLGKVRLIDNMLINEG